MLFIACLGASVSLEARWFGFREWFWNLFKKKPTKTVSTSSSMSGEGTPSTQSDLDSQKIIAREKERLQMALDRLKNGEPLNSTDYYELLLDATTQKDGTLTMDSESKEKLLKSIDKVAAFEDFMGALDAADMQRQMKTEYPKFLGEVVNAAKAQVPARELKLLQSNIEYKNALSIADSAKDRQRGSNFLNDIKTGSSNNLSPSDVQRLAAQEQREVKATGTAAQNADRNTASVSRGSVENHMINISSNQEVTPDEASMSLLKGKQGVKAPSVEVYTYALQRSLVGVDEDGNRVATNDPNHFAIDLDGFSRNLLPSLKTTEALDNFTQALQSFVEKPSGRLATGGRSFARGPEVELRAVLASVLSSGQVPQEALEGSSVAQLFTPQQLESLGYSNVSTSLSDNGNGDKTSGSEPQQLQQEDRGGDKKPDGSFDPAKEGGDIMVE